MAPDFFVSTQGLIDWIFPGNSPKPSHFFDYFLRHFTAIYSISSAHIYSYRRFASYTLAIKSKLKQERQQYEITDNTKYTLIR